MSDLIYRKALQAAASEKMTVVWYEDGTPVMRETMTARELDRLIRDATAVDAALVVHAWWIYSGGMDEDGNCEANCSNCGAGDKHRPDLKDAVPYCWNCGARMDGEADV